MCVHFNFLAFSGVLIATFFMGCRCITLEPDLRREESGREGRRRQRPQKLGSSRAQKLPRKEGNSMKPAS
jgi:hypothetical protein